MAHLFLAIFLIVLGLNMIFLALSIPPWVIGIVAIITGILFLFERLGGRAGSKS